MNKYLKSLLILLCIFITFVIISCKSTDSEIQSPKSKIQEVTILTYSGNEFPKPTGYINDYTNTIDQNYEDKISSEITKVKEETDAEIVVIAVDSLEGKSIDDYTLELFNTWQVNRYGIILLLSMKEQKIRITTGYDMENVITDDIANSIINDVIIPKFQESNFNEGIYQGVKKISDYILAYESK